MSQTPSVYQQARVGHVGRFVRQALRGDLAPYWREQTVLATTVVLPVALRTLLPISIGVLIDEAIPGKNVELMLMTLGALIVLSLGAVLAELVQAHVRALFGEELERDLRLKLFQHIQTLPVSYFESVPPGTLTAIFAHELVVLRDTLRGLVVNGFRALLQLFATLAAMISLDWKLTLGLMLILPVTLRLQRRALRRSERADFQENQQDAEVASAVQDNLSSYLMVRTFGMEQQAIEDFEKRVLDRSGGPVTLNRYRWNTILRGLRSPAFMKGLVVTAANIQQTLLYLLALCVGGWLAFRDTLTVGTYSALLALILNLGQAILSLAAFLQETISGATAQERIDSVLRSQGGEPVQLELPPLRWESGCFEFRSVRFGYGGEAILKDLSFRLPTSGIIAFVGRSGCGKSSLLKLLLRLYVPSSGQILMDEQPLRMHSLSSWRNHIGVVMQDGALLNRSVRENIAIAHPQASDEEIHAAARAAGVHDAILALPQGYATEVGEQGQRLSPGQRQRVALARALLGQPRLLLLDEICSALDPEAEESLHQTLRQWAQQRPVIMMTHRLASLREGDTVLVLDQGRLVQQGDHAALLRSPGPYRAMGQVQSGFVVSQDGRHAEVSAERLATIPLFADLERETLQHLATAFVSQFFGAGQTICQEGEIGERFFLIARGRVRVLAQGRESQKVHVASLMDGDYFGEDALLDATVYSTECECETPTLVLVLSRHDFARWIGSAEGMRDAMQETALTRSLTLCARRGRRHSRIAQHWERLFESAS